MRLKIGIVGSVIGYSVGVQYNYTEYIRRYFMGDPVILLPDSDIRSDLDLLILPGGADINPLRYGEIPIYGYDDPDLMKEYFDEFILPRYIAAGVPILGICRGLQTLNVHFGGTLQQDMLLEHETNKKDDPYEAVHRVILEENKRFIKVNSRHHQAVARLGDGLVTLGTHPNGTIEAFKHESLRVLGVQWHPEDLYERDAEIWLSVQLKTIMKK